MSNSLSMYVYTFKLKDLCSNGKFSVNESRMSNYRRVKKRILFEHTHIS